MRFLEHQWRDLRWRDRLSALIIVLCLGAVILPYVMPVVVFDRADNLRRTTSGDVRASLGAWKVRGCQVVSGSFVGWARGPDGWREVGFAWIDDLSPDSSNPAGMFFQTFGLAEWSGVSRSATSVRLTVLHSCGGRAPFVSVMGPYRFAGRQ